MNKLIINTLIMVTGIIFGQSYQYTSKYLTEELRSSPKALLKFRDVGKSIEGLQDQVEFYRAVSEAFGMEIEKLNDVSSEKFTKFDGLIDQYLGIINTDVHPIQFPDEPEISYTYKAIKLTKKAVEKQSHRKQALLLMKNYITLFKFYKEKTVVYTEYLTILKELKETGVEVEKKVAAEAPQTVPVSVQEPATSTHIETVPTEQEIPIKDEPGQMTTVDKPESKTETVPEEKTQSTFTETDNYPEAKEPDSLTPRVVDEGKVTEILDKLQSHSDQEKEIVLKSETRESVGVPVQEKKAPIGYDNFLEAFQSAQAQGLSEFSFQDTEISTVTREQFREAMINARIFGKETFTIGGRTYSSNLKFEKTEKITK